MPERFQKALEYAERFQVRARVVVWCGVVWCYALFLLSDGHGTNMYIDTPAELWVHMVTYERNVVHDVKASAFCLNEIRLMRPCVRVYSVMARMSLACARHLSTMSSGIRTRSR